METFIKTLSSGNVAKLRYVDLGWLFRTGRFPIALRHEVEIAMHGWERLTEIQRYQLLGKTSALRLLFDTVCLMAIVEPEFTMESIKEILIRDKVEIFSAAIAKPPPSGG